MRLFTLALLATIPAVAAAKDDPIFEPGAKLKTEAAAGVAGEGPAWDAQLGVLTSGNGNINRLSRDGKSTVYRPKAGTNGLLFDRKGRLLACEPDHRRVTRTEKNGTITVLTDRFEGKRYNSPNDLTIDSRGRIYFSDPRYGPRAGMELRDGKGNPIEGVYRIDPDGKVSRVLGREVDRANGVLVSADDKYLFVADNNNDTIGAARKLWALRPEERRHGGHDEQETAARLGHGSRPGRGEAGCEGSAVRGRWAEQAEPAGGAGRRCEGRHLRDRPADRKVARVPRRTDRRGDQLRVRRRRPEDALHHRRRDDVQHPNDHPRQPVTQEPRPSGAGVPGMITSTFRAIRRRPTAASGADRRAGPGSPYRRARRPAGRARPHAAAW